MTSVPPRYVGVDVGGTKTAAALVDADGQVLSRRSAATPHTGGPDVLRLVADLVADLVDAHAGEAEAAGLGVGCPGVVDTVSGTVVSATDLLPGWAGTRVGDVLGRLTGLPVSVDNDVRAMAFGELKCGAGSEHPDALFLSVGTGIGGAVARGGTLLHGPHASTGEFAHLLQPSPGPIPCGCGRTDHLEAVASGPAIEAAYAAAVGGDRLPLREVARRMREGDADARAAVTGAARLLGRVIAGLLIAIDADAVVVGGGVAQIGADFLDPFADALRTEATPSLLSIPVLPARLGTDAPLIGAARLARESEPVAA